MLRWQPCTPCPPCMQMLLEDAHLLMRLWFNIPSVDCPLCSPSEAAGLMRPSTPTSSHLLPVRRLLPLQPPPPAPPRAALGIAARACPQLLQADPEAGTGKDLPQAQLEQQRGAREKLPARGKNEMRPAEPARGRASRDSRCTDCNPQQGPHKGAASGGASLGAAHSRRQQKRWAGMHPYPALLLQAVRVGNPSAMGIMAQLLEVAVEPCTHRHMHTCGLNLQF